MDTDDLRPKTSWTLPKCSGLDVASSTCKGLVVALEKAPDGCVDLASVIRLCDVRT